MTQYPAVTSTDGFPQTAAYDQGSGAALPLAAGSVLTDANHGSQKSAELLVQVADSAGTNVAGVDSSHNLLVKVNAAVPAGTNLIGGTNLVDSAGTNKAGVDAQHAVQVSDGGTGYVGVTASSAAAVKAAAGRLCKVIVLTTVTAAVTIYDNTNAASGQALLTIPTSAAVGTIYSPQTPAGTGLYVGGGAGTPALVVQYA